MAKLSPLDFMTKVADSDPKTLVLLQDGSGDIEVAGERHSCEPLMEDVPGAFHAANGDLLKRAAEILAAAYAHATAGS